MSVEMAMEVMKRVSRLPALPQAVLALQHTLDDEGASVAACADQIRCDASLTARMLRLANSAFYGVPGRVASVDDAVHLIGVRPLRGLVTTAALSMQFEPPEPQVLSLAGFWRHTLACAFASLALAEALGLDEETAYTAGLLHDIGRLALATYLPETMRGHPPSIADERAAIGTDHAEVGAAIARHWHLPPVVADVIGCHHEPPPSEHPTLADIVHVADAFAHSLGYSHEMRREPPPVDAGAGQRVGLERLPQAQLLEQTRSAVDGTCEALGL